MVTYFRGLAEQRGRNNHFTPNLSLVTAQYAASLAGPALLGGARATNFTGKVAVIDRHGNVVSLYSDVTSAHLGVAPDFGFAPFSTGEQGRYGGNMDFNETTEGSTVFLNVTQPGALLYLGDAHAAMGDGETTEWALETSIFSRRDQKQVHRFTTR